VAAGDGLPGPDQDSCAPLGRRFDRARRGRVAQQMNDGAGMSGWRALGPKVMGVAAVLALAAAACGGTSTGSSGGSTASPASSPTTSASTKGFLACEVTDTGGINDRSFNASAYAGLKEAAQNVPGLTYQYLQSNSTSDYTPNINTFLSRHCGIIITVGFDMASATEKAAKANPSQPFAIIDNPESIPNIKALTYETNQSAFLGGYLAAAMSKSGTVGTFGGQNIPPVTIYMDGWVAGVRYYNKQNHANVKVLGWTPKPGRAANSLAGNGLFTNDFTNQLKGKTDAQTLMSQGADIIFPVAGQVGLGAAAAVKQAGGSNYMEWVDVDGCVSAPQYCSLFITSVEKGITHSVAAVVEQAARGAFQGGTYVGTLKNDGVGIAPYHEFAGKVPSKVTNALNTIEKGIETGQISVDPNSYPAN
jgi:basic membrane protein A and related proteins